MNRTKQALIFSLVASLAPLSGAYLPFVVQHDQAPLPLASPSKGLSDVKVPIHLGVMSQCPDAIFCHRLFDQVLPKVGDKVDMKLVYVATFDKDEPVYGARCLHGPTECAGNIQQLCTEKYAPEEWWRFIHCQNYQGRWEVGLPETAYKCAAVTDIDLDESGVSQCAGLDSDDGPGEEGVALFHESILLGKSLGIERSCTILINGRHVCVHDGVWKQCEDGHTVNDFVRQINEEYDRLNA
ncbi:hypothetical protein DL96DRAFT_1498752 [Flagelloscypha sp. PMI_526]|nr:hypothetical protein DL96DRAFT_1498752 [Flagelloscypha sp. PMI_526]